MARPWPRNGRAMTGPWLLPWPSHGRAMAGPWPIGRNIKVSGHRRVMGEPWPGTGHGRAIAGSWPCHGTPHSIARVLLDVFPKRKGHTNLQVYVPNSTAGTPLDRRGPPGTSICTENQPHRPMLRLCREANKNPPQIPARSQGMGL